MSSLEGLAHDGDRGGGAGLAFGLNWQLTVRKDCQLDTGLLVACNVAFITGSADNLCLSHYGLNG